MSLWEHSQRMEVTKPVRGMWEAEIKKEKGLDKSGINYLGEFYKYFKKYELIKNLKDEYRKIPLFLKCKLKFF